MKNLYFAYGSNLSVPDWRRYCAQRGVSPKELIFHSRAWLPDFEVCFHYRSEARKGGALTIRERLGTAVPGALFEAGEATWSILDGKEGLARGRYERISVVALDAKGREWPSTTYRVSDAFRTEEPMPPAAGYRELVTAALNELDLPTSQLDEAASGKPPAALPSGLFTYGTLMRNESLWPALSEAVSGDVVEATCPGCLLDLGEYPALIDGDGDERVRGELVPLVSPEAWVASIDAIEGFLGYGDSDSLYRRIVRQVESPAGPTHAWTYLYLGPASEAGRIAGGDWRNRHP